jgi:hypothetical protein
MPGQSAAKTTAKTNVKTNANATPNLPDKMDIRATAKWSEIIPARYQKCQCGADSRHFTAWFMDGMFHVYCRCSPGRVTPLRARQEQTRRGRSPGFAN